MHRQRLKALFLSLVCTVMLVVQWLPAHAHLDAAHQHDGARHEHLATVHAHQPVVAHGDALDVGHVEQDLGAVVDLDQSYCLGAHGLDPGHINSHAARIAAPPGLSYEVPQRDGRRRPNRPTPHVGEPRAPPQHP